MSNRITKPSRSNRKSGSAKPNANGNTKYCGNCGTAVTGKFCTECGTAINANATAETPKAAKPRYENAVIGGLTIWISNPANGKSFAWLEKSIQIDELRKLGDFKPAEYDKSK